MKTIKLLALTLLALMIACVAPRPVTDTEESATDPTVELSDSTEYELVIFDSEFNSWMSMNARPMSFYSEEYLKTWNDRLVTEWNNFSPSQGRVDCRPNSYLDWDRNVDYGKELNYQLFNYFRFMQERCRIFMSTPGEW